MSATNCNIQKKRNPVLIPVLIVKERKKERKKKWSKY